MRLAFVSSLVALSVVLAATLLTRSVHAQITSISGPDQPSLIRGSCFATVNNKDRHLRVEEIRNAWIRVAIAADKTQTNTLVRVETRWINAAYLQEIVTLSGPKACDFLE